MKRHPPSRHGFVMVFVLAIMGLLIGILAVFTHVTIGMHTAYKHERVRLSANLLAESGAAWARSHTDAWATATLPEPVQLDASNLLAPGILGSITVRVQRVNNERVCRIDAAATQRGYCIKEQRIVLLKD